MTKVTKFIVDFWDLLAAIVEQFSSSNEGEINDFKKKSHFLSVILLKFETCSFFSGSKQQEKTSIERSSKLHLLPRVSCRLTLHFSC